VIGRRGGLLRKLHAKLAEKSGAHAEEVDRLHAKIEALHKKQADQRSLIENLRQRRS
jgi:hypothetical protein